MANKDTAQELLSQIVAETELEKAITNDPSWKEGALWGKPRKGHPEGSVAAHIKEVLENIDSLEVSDSQREALRLIALIHDTFKHRVNKNLPLKGENHHATIARRFAEAYIFDSPLLDIIELHDEAYNSYNKGVRGDWPKAQARAWRLISRLQDNLPLYLLFFDVDNRTGDKERASYQWFASIARNLESVRD
jgi:hypothetical protein